MGIYSGLGKEDSEKGRLWRDWPYTEREDETGQVESWTLKNGPQIRKKLVWEKQIAEDKFGDIQEIKEKLVALNRIRG